MSTNFEVEEAGSHREPSQCEKLCGSIFVAICIAPLLFLGSVFITGWNERNAVCNGRAFDAGKAVVKEPGCASDPLASEGQLLFVNCPISGGFQPINQLAVDYHTNYFAGAQSDVPAKGVLGIRATVEMYQCIETETPGATTKDSAGKTHQGPPTYSYALGWRSGAAPAYKNAAIPVGSCAKTANPPFPALPTASHSVLSMIVGKFTVPATAVSLVPVDTAVKFTTPPAGWKVSDAYLFKGASATSSMTAPIVGDKRVTVYTNPNRDIDIVAFGKNTLGVIGKWMAPAGFPCSEISLEDYQLAKKTKDQFFEGLHAVNGGIMWFLRVVGFALMWFALTRFFGPLEVMAECVPCIGPMLGDFVEAVVCVATCPPACGCCLCVVAVMWVVNRPVAGVIMFICWCLCVGGAIGSKFYLKNQQKTGHQDMENQS